MAFEVHYQCFVVNKCANKNCSNLFLYFREGKLFQFPRQTEDKFWMEAFWLCGDCSRDFTLHWELGSEVDAIPTGQSPGLRNRRVTHIPLPGQT